jgi:hypothetical protein
MSVTVLSGPNGGLIVRLQNDLTGEVMADLLTREQAEALIEQATATLRCAPLDPNAGKAASFSHWTSIHAAGQCAVCNEWEQRRAGHVCIDCDGGPGPCTCQIAERPHLAHQTMVLGVCRDCYGPAEGMICRDCLMKRGA